ncbi:DNA polymerase III subunit alpha [Kitasatospora sp. RB6PN24]|uniref:DNA polymerase III subunit alpha n=1 Tax=Kitasatospora humi TaxID=2893891 RepID=UPI001E3F7C47|nr:DNA polymerase III subunit alpha [Kitasatospora humi]MCC9307942.1 DNA polymerase III subunit alpha [Kitasatospora humi]
MFAQLHVASAFSERYGASRPAQLARRAAERGIATLALTDRDTVMGTSRFLRACRRAGVRPILGVDLAVEPVAPEPAGPPLRTTAHGGAHGTEHPLRITLLARSAAGWARLCQLVSAAHTVPGRPVLTWEQLCEHGGDGLLVLLGPVSEPVRALGRGRADVAEQLLVPWLEVFGPAVRLEAVGHCLPGEGPGSLRLAARTLALGDRVRVPVVLTGAVRYADADQHRVADVLDAARLLRPIDRRVLDRGERWLKDGALMRQAAERIAAAGHGRDRAVRLLADTVAAADACTLQPHRDLGLGRPHLPEPHLVGAASGPGGAARALRERCEAGLVRRGLDHDPGARARLDQELAVISRTGYDTYFLVVDQVVRDIRAMGLRVAARGSGAGSMVNHVLGIAAANPLEHGLLFERFLTERRTDMPDIDLDVEAHRRLDVYRRVIERFGTSRVAITGMPETYRARQALRTVGLALGIDPDETDEIAKSFPHIPAAGIRQGLRELPELRPLAARAHRYGALWELAEALDGLVAGVAQHPCGVIITDGALLDRLPVQPTPTGDFPMVQADKYGVELDRDGEVGDGFGLIKLDILGVRMQSAMSHAVREVARTTGAVIDLDDPHQVPPDDPFAFLMIQAADTIGMYQLESPGQQDLISRLRPRDLKDVIADISLFRPGPVAGGMPAQYIAARHGHAPAYPHPDLEPVLADTYGVTIWHEQIIGILAVMTGCDLALAEEARRSLGDPVRLEKIKAWFHREAGRRGYDRRTREAVWGIVNSFGAYGFCRAHATAFAVPALQSAYLKAHHPAAQYAGLLEHDPGMWPPRVIVADARRHQVPILPVDVNRSDAHYRVEEHHGVWGVRMALSAVHGITAEETARLVAGQPYTSLSDLWERAHPSRPLAERLISIGALDTVAGPLNRHDLLLQAARLHREQRNRRALTGQLPLDSAADSAAGAGGAVPSGLPEMTEAEKVSAELRILGMDVTSHLMEHHLKLLHELGTVDAHRLGGLAPGTTVLVAGVRASTQTPPIASGTRIIFVTLDGVDGLVDLAFFEDSHPACARTIFHSGLLLVRGTVTRRGPRTSITGTACWDLAELAELRRDQGLDAVTARLAQPLPHPAGATVRPETMPTGARRHPWADLQTPGERAPSPRRLTHTSPGSAG